MNKDVVNALKNRKTIYQLGKDVSLGKDEIAELIKRTIYELPSAFNCQSTRVAILFGEEHEKLWDIIEKKEEKAMFPEDFEKFKERVVGFKKGYGTVLFFEDQNVIKETADGANLEFERVEQWSHEHQGAATVAIWTALADNNIGANLQHYIYNVREEVQETWNIPEYWKLYAQLVFGSIEDSRPDKEKVDIDKRVKIFG